MGIEIESKVFFRTSTLEQHPTTYAYVDPDYTLTGGGAWIEYQEPGNLLVQCCPIKERGGTAWTGWKAQGKDVWVGSKAQITAYAIGIKITKDGKPVPIEQTVFLSDDEMTEIPSSPENEGWVGVGGGVKCEQNVFENVLLSESAPMRGFPDKDASEHPVTSWYGTKMYCFSPTSNRGPTGGGTITTYLIAIKADGIKFKTRIFCAESEMAPRPEVQVLADGATIVSGGAFDLQSEVSFTEYKNQIVNMLTASYPVFEEASPDRILGWKAAGKDHHYACESMVKAYAISLQAE